MYMLLKKDTSVIRNMNNMIKRLNDLSDYSVSEADIEEAKEENELSEIFKSN